MFITTIIAINDDEPSLGRSQSMRRAYIIHKNLKLCECDVIHFIRTTVSSGGAGDDYGDVPAVQRLHHYQVYRGLSPGSASRLEVRGLVIPHLSDRTHVYWVLYPRFFGWGDCGGSWGLNEKLLYSIMV